MKELEAFIEKYDTASNKQLDDKPTVLIVDDDKSICEGLRTLLENKYNIKTAINGYEAIDLINSSIHCVVLDIKMKELDGFKTFIKLKDKNLDVPVIFYTAFQDEHNLYEIINKYRPDGYFSKGRKIVGLENNIEKAVKKYQVILENNDYKLNIEKKIAERTEKIKKLQGKLIEQEGFLVEKQLAGGMAHQIKNKLGAVNLRIENIKGNKSTRRVITVSEELVKNGQVDSRRNSIIKQLIENITYIQKNIMYIKEIIDKCTAILNKIVEYSKLDVLSPNRETIRIYSIMDNILKTYSVLLDKEKIKIKLSISTDILIFAEKEKLYSLFENVILNAIDAIIEADLKNKKIDIQGGSNKEEITVIIKDNGIGIKKEEMDKIFHPFYTNKKREGMGLGLSECKKIINLYNGNIEVFSVFNKETVVKIRLPYNI